MSQKKPQSGGTCAVLGAKGFVGSAVARVAEERGYDVTRIDIDEYEAARGRRFDLLINANGNSRKYLGRTDPSKEFDLSVRSVQRSLQDFKTDYYLHLSTIDVYPDHENPANNTEDTVIDESALSPYGLHKYLAEKLVRYYAPCWSIVRMGGFVGPGLWKNSIHDLLKGTDLRVSPDSAYQYLHTRDLGRLLFELVDAARPMETWNIAGEGLITLRQIASGIPHAKLPPDDAALPCERYEVSVAKAASVVHLPRTAETVPAFIQDVLSGRETIQ